MDVMRVAASSPQANLGDAVGKPEVKGKRQMDLSEVWAAIFAQVGALNHTAAHATGSVGESVVERADTPSAAKTFRVREPGGTSAERMLPPGSLSVRAPSATSIPSDGITWATGDKVAMPRTDSRLQPLGDDGLFARSAGGADVAERAGEMGGVRMASQDGPHANIAKDTVQNIARVSGDHAQAQDAGTGEADAADAVPSVPAGHDAVGASEPNRHRRADRSMPESSAGGTSFHAAASDGFNMAVAVPVGAFGGHELRPASAERSDAGKPVTSTIGSLGADLRAWMTTEGDSTAKTLTVALEPKELGAVKVIVHHGDEGLQIQLVASTAASASLLAAQLPALMQQMAQGGLSVRDVSVGLATDAGETGSGEQQRDRGDSSVAGTVGAGTVSSSRFARAGYGDEGEYPVSLINLYA